MWNLWTSEMPLYSRNFKRPQERINQQCKGWVLRYLFHIRWQVPRSMIWLPYDQELSTVFSVQWRSPTSDFLRQRVQLVCTRHVYPPRFWRQGIVFLDKPFRSIPADGHRPLGVSNSNLYDGCSHQEFNPSLHVLSSGWQPCNKPSVKA